MESYLKQQMERAFMRAIKIFGSQKKLAKALGISRSRLNHYFTGKIAMPWVIAFAIEQLTKAEGEEKKVSALQLAGYLNAEEKAAVILQALDTLKLGLLPLHEKPLLVEYLYSYNRYQPCEISCLNIRGCTFTQALKRVGLSLEEYNQITLVNQQGTDELITAMNCRVVTLAQAVLIAMLSAKEQSNLLSLDGAERLAAIKALAIQNAEHPHNNTALAPLDYLRLLQNDADILPLRANLSLYSTLAIHFAIEITLKNRQGQRSDLSKSIKNRQKEAVLDEVNPVMMRVGGDFEEILKNLDEVRTHVAALAPISGDINAFFSNQTGRTDDLLAAQIGLKRQTYRYLKIIFLNQSELIPLIEAGNISIFSAYQQVKTKQHPPLINNYEEESE